MVRNRTRARWLVAALTVVAAAALRGSAAEAECYVNESESVYCGSPCDYADRLWVYQPPDYGYDSVSGGWSGICDSCCSGEHCGYDYEEKWVSPDADPC